MKIFKQLTIAALVVICILFLRDLILKFKPVTPQNEIVTEHKLMYDIKTITNKYNLDGYVGEIIQNGYDDYYTYLTDGVIGSGFVLEIDTYNKIFFNSKYGEVYAYIDIWLYLKEHETKFTIDGIYFRFMKRFKFVLPCVLSISREEFNTLYDEVNADGILLRNDKVKAIAKAYVEKYNYVRQNGY